MSIGRVEVSSTYDVWWRVEPNSEWAPRTGGEYHTVELQDGRLALVRWIGAQSDEKGMRCRSLYLAPWQRAPQGYHELTFRRVRMRR